MIPLQISPEEYVKYFKPTPDYLIAVRRLDNYEKLGNIIIPDKIAREGVRFISQARILTVSPYESADPWIESMKAILRTKTHVAFEFHVVCPVHLPPQFEFPKEDNVIMLHVKDVTILPEDNVNELFERQRKWEAEEEERVSASLAKIRKEVVK